MSMASPVARDSTSAARPSRLLAAGANALAATILGLTVAYGLRFAQTTHVDWPGAVPPSGRLWCLFVGECRPVDVAHCFSSSHVMILVLAVGGILVGDFTLWAYAQHEACLEEEDDDLRRSLRAGAGAGAARQDGKTARSAKSWLGRWQPSRGDGGGRAAAEAGGDGLGQSESSSTLLLTIISVLCCASALALFAPHKVVFELKDPLWSFPSDHYLETTDGRGGVRYINNAAVITSVSHMLTDSANIRGSAVYKAIDAGEEYDRTLPDVGLYRVGGVMFPGLRTRGMGINMESFEGEPYLLQHEVKVRLPLNSVPFPRPKVVVAPDYKFLGLNTTVHGTDIYARCEDVTAQMWTRRRLIPRAKEPMPGEHWKAGQQYSFDVSGSGLSLNVVHQPGDNRRVTPVLDGTSTQFIVVTDNNSLIKSVNSDWNATVFQCEYRGSEILAMTAVDPTTGALKVRSSVEISDLGGEVLAETSIGIKTALASNGWGSLEYALKAARRKLIARGETHRVNLLDQQLIEDVLTDMAQAFWSLKRQQLETAAEISPSWNPPALSGGNMGRQHGSFTRLGGAGWGLILPVLMMLLPARALSCLVSSAAARGIFPSSQTGDEEWRLVPQNDEEENHVEYVDSPPQLPQPRDEEPTSPLPPPYTVHA